MVESHEHESLRLFALRGLRLLDTEESEPFRTLTRLTQRVLGMPIALISLVDTDRQWFLSRCGLSVGQTPRSEAFCSVAIEGESVLVVPDATQDDRFRNSALVTGPPHIRFYAGSPITGPNGHLLGTLCVIDTVPRTFSAEDLETLVDLRRMVESAIEARFVQSEREREQEIFSDTLAMVGHDLRTPLSTVKMGLKLIGAAAAPSDAMRNAIGMVERASVQLEGQLESLLELSVLRSGGTVYTADMAQQLQDAWNELHRSEQARLVVGELPRVPTVGVSLQHVFQNLLSNALIHGGDDVVVRVSSKLMHDMWHVRVSDNGRGMTDEALATLFQTSIAEDSKYHGVGLCIVKRLVEAVGGEVGVHSTVGKGTTLWFSWPALLCADRGVC